MSKLRAGPHHTPNQRLERTDKNLAIDAEKMCSRSSEPLARSVLGEGST